MVTSSPVRSSSQLDAAITLHRAGRVAEALAQYRRLRPTHPKDFRLLHLGGTALLKLGHTDEAVKWLEAAAALQPKNGSTRMCLALALARLNRRDAAAVHFAEATKLEPNNAEVWSNYGMFLLQGGQLAEAVEVLKKAVRLKPNDVAPAHNLGRLFSVLGRAEEALPLHEHALTLAPADAAGYVGYGQALYGCNRLGEAQAAFERAVDLDPQELKAAGYRLMLLHYRDDLSREQVAAEHRAFGRLCPAPSQAAAALVHAPRDPDKRLRVAFLSPDLRQHAVAFFLEPLLAHLPKDEFEIVLYHDHFSRDAVSARLRTQASLWREFAGRDDESVGQTIRQDAPDILIELAGHTGSNRLPLLARRLAPVQITYLGYPNTTGVPAMDFRFTDAVADPVSADVDALHTERLVRFAPTAWSYEPPENAPAVSAPPCASGAAPVFGSFNNLSKVSATTLRLWARLLAEVPTARLMLKGYQADSKLAQRAKAAGIPEERLIVLPPAAGLAAHLATYARVDVALDPLPYHGTTTTCEALWMGRPVVTRAGDRHVNRVGASLLTAVGQEDCIAGSPEEYIARAVALVADPTALAARCAGLRSRMAASPLLDHAGQAACFAHALRACWRQAPHGPAQS